MTQNPYVSTALAQDFGREQQSRARGNIGAASSSDLSTLESSVGSLKDRVAAAEDSLKNKKDNQTELIFDAPPNKTITHIVQSKSGKITVVFTDIDFSSEHIDPATANPSMDGSAAAGVSVRYAREDHVHPSDTSKEAVANKTTVVLGTSDSNYPTDKAVAEFVNSSIATNTAHYISDNGDPFTSVAALEAYAGTVTNNDYAFVTGTDSEGNTYYDRYKATDNDSTITWGREYRLNNSSFTAAQWASINSGITAALVSKIHEHSNKTVLDGITETNVNNWNGKMNKVSGATAGNVATLDANGNIVDSGKTLGTSVPSDAVFTDAKVTQTKNDSSNIEFPLLMAGTEDPNGTATTTHYDSDVKLNPSTKTISANISGNAATADIATSTSSGSIPSDADLNNYTAANRNYICNADNASTVTNKPSGASGAFELEVIRGTGSTCVQVYYSRDVLNFNYIRKCTGINDAWTDWVKLIDSSDINSLSSAVNKLSNTVGNLSYQVAANTGALDGMKWTKVDLDTNVTTAATQLFTVGNLSIGYYFDSATTFRLSMKSLNGTHYIYLSDNMGYGGGYQVTDSSWNGITMRGFSGSCQYESFIGYDCTADTPIHFEVYYANSANSLFGLICRYRVLEG